MDSSNDGYSNNILKDTRMWAFFPILVTVSWLLATCIYEWLGWVPAIAIVIIAILYGTQVIILVPAFTARVIVNNFTGKRRGIGNGWHFILPPPIEMIDVNSDTDIQTLGHSFKTVLETGKRKKPEEKDEDKDRYEPVDLIIGVTDTPSIKYLPRFRMIQKKEDRQKEVDKYITSFLTSIQQEYTDRADVMEKVGVIGTRIMSECIKKENFREGLPLDHFFGLDITNISVDVELPEELKKAGIEREATNQRNMAQSAKTKNQEERARLLVESSKDGSLLFKEALQFVMMADGSNIKKDIQEKKFALDITTLQAVTQAIDKMRPSSSIWDPASLDKIKEVIKEVGNVLKKD